jgi:uncharacterized protein YjeT (DUF2065 family)
VNCAVAGKVTSLLHPQCAADTALGSVRSRGCPAWLHREPRGSPTRLERQLSWLMPQVVRLVSSVRHPERRLSLEGSVALVMGLVVLYVDCEGLSQIAVSTALLRRWSHR